MVDVTLSSLLADYDANLAALTDTAVSSLVNRHIPLLGHLCGDLPDKVVWKMMYLSYHQLRVQDRCTMLSVVTDYIIHSPVLLETSKSGTDPSDIIRVLAQCWQNTLPSGKRGLDVRSFHNLTVTLARCVSQLRTYHLHDPFKVVLKQAMRLKKQARADVGKMNFPNLIEPNFPRIAEMSHNKMRRFRSSANLTPVAMPPSSTAVYQTLPQQVRPVDQPSTIRQKFSTPPRLRQIVRPQPPRSTNVRREPSAPGNVNRPVQTNPANGMSSASPVIRITHILARKVLSDPAHEQRNTNTPVMPAPQNLSALTRKNPANPSTSVRKMSPQNPSVQARQVPSSPFPVYTSTQVAQSPSAMAPTSSQGPSVQARKIPSSPFPTNTSTVAHPSLFVSVHIRPPLRQTLSTHTQPIPFTPVSTLVRQNPAPSATKPPPSPYRQSVNGKGIPSSRRSTSSPVKQATPLQSPATAGYTLQQRPHTPTRHLPTSSTAPQTPVQPTPSACVDTSSASRNLLTLPQSANRLTGNQRKLIHAELRRLHLVSSSPAMPLHTPKVSLTPNKRPKTTVSEASVLHPAKKRLIEARQSVYRQTQSSTLHPADRTVTKELFFN